MKAKIIIFVILMLFLHGCAVGPRFIVNIDSISSPDSELKNKFVLLPGSKDIDQGSLQYKEYAAYVERALFDKGFIKSNNMEAANVAIFLVYGIGDPQEHQFTYSIPIWGQTGVASSSTIGTINTFGNTGTYSATTTNTPTYGIVGSSTHTGTRITYFKYLWLDAVDLDEYRRTEKVNQLWKTMVTSTGSSGDLRQVFPVLVGAAKEYFGTNTGKKVQVTLFENDKRVLDVKGIQK